jgi:RNA polymerase sigma factor (sigma-70 family)
MNPADHIGIAGAAAARFARIENVDIEDSEAFGDACVALVRAALAFDPERGLQFSTLAVRACNNAVLDGLRQRTGWRRRERDKLHFHAIGDTDHECTARSEIDVQEIVRDVHAAIDKLPERNSYIVQRRLEGATLETIGAEVGLTKERVRQIWLQSLEMMRVVLVDYG